MHEQWFYVTLKNPQPPLNSVNPFIFAFTFGEVSSEATYSNDAMISIANPFQIFFPAIYKGERLSGGLIRQMIPKTSRFPGVTISNLDDRLQEVASAASIYKRAIILNTYHSEGIDDYVLRFQTLWYFLADLIRNCVVTEFNHQTVDQQRILFLRLLVDLMHQEIDLCIQMQGHEKIKFAVDQDFLKQEIFTPMMANGWLVSEGALNAEFEHKIAQYPARNSANVLVVIPQDQPVDAAASDVLYGSMALKQQGIYGTAKSTTVELYSQARSISTRLVVEAANPYDVLPPARLPAVMSSLSLDLGAAASFDEFDDVALEEPQRSGDYVFSAGEAATLSVCEVAGNTGIAASGASMSRGRFSPGEALMVEVNLDPEPLPLPFDETTFMSVGGESIYGTKYNDEVPTRPLAMLCFLINGDLKLNLKKPGVSFYKLGGFRFMGRIFGAKRRERLNHTLAKQGLQILLAMCVYHSGRSYYRILEQFSRLYPDFYAELQHIPTIFAHCKGYEIPTLPEIREIRELLTTDYIAHDVGIPRWFKDELLAVLGTVSSSVLVKGSTRRTQALGLRLRFEQALIGAIAQEMWLYLLRPLVMALSVEVRDSFDRTLTTEIIRKASLATA